MDLEPQQADLLERICAGELISITALQEANALELPPQRKRKPHDRRQLKLDLGD